MSLVSALHLITSAFLEAMRRRWYLDALLRAGIQAADDVEEEPPVEDEDNKTIFSDEGSNCSESVATIVPEQAELPREEQADTLQEQAELPREELILFKNKLTCTGKPHLRLHCVVVRMPARALSWDRRKHLVLLAHGSSF